LRLLRQGSAKMSSKLPTRGLILRNTLSVFGSTSLANFSTRSVYKFQPLTKSQTKSLLHGKQWLRFYSSNLPEHIKVTLPALSPTMEMGSIVAWAKKEGEQVVEGDLLCEIETDKATMGFETPEEGYLAKIFLPEGSRDIPIGKFICIIVEKESDVSAFKDFNPDKDGAKSEPAKSPKKQEEPKQQASAPSPNQQQIVQTGDRLKVTPYAKKLAAEQGISLQTLQGSGPEGRIIASDISGGTGQTPQSGQATQVKSEPAQSQVQQQPKATTQSPSRPSQAGSAHYEDIQLTNMRKTIAKRLTESKNTIPHYYLTSEIIVDDLLNVREKLNSIVAKESDASAGKPHKLSINDFIIKASALSCLRVPEANSFFMDTFIRKNNTVDVSVAVSTDAGLITPIIFDADSKGLLTISKEVTELAGRARAGKLQPQEFQGGTFTVSNLGMFGSVDHFTAIINPPQSCILAIGGANKKLIPSEDGHKQVTTVKVTLSCDHRVVDGAIGAVWLKHFKGFLEKPHTMLL